MKIDNLNYHHWIPRTRKHTHERFNTTNSVKKSNIQGGGVATTPMGVNVGRNDLVVGGLTA